MNEAGKNTVESLGKDTIENSDSSALSTNLYVVIEAMGPMLNIVKMPILKDIACLNILRRQMRSNGLTVDTLCRLLLPGNQPGATRTQLHF